MLTKRVLLLALVGTAVGLGACTEKKTVYERGPRERVIVHDDRDQAYGHYRDRDWDRDRDRDDWRREHDRYYDYRDRY